MGKTPVNMLMKLQIPWNAWNFLTVWVNISFSRTVLPLGSYIKHNKNKRRREAENSAKTRSSYFELLYPSGVPSPFIRQTWQIWTSDKQLRWWQDSDYSSTSKRFSRLFLLERDACGCIDIQCNLHFLFSRTSTFLSFPCHMFQVTPWMTRARKIRRWIKIFIVLRTISIFPFWYHRLSFSASTVQISEAWHRYFFEGSIHF
jgi:hypothetical protein